MKRRLVYSPEALGDLDDTGRYTRLTWGNAQAKKYVAGLVADIKALRVSGLRYPLYEQVLPSLRRKRSAMHNIYYRAFDDRIEIVRILHVQRDPGSHLREGVWRED